MNAIVIFSIAGTLGALTLPGGQVSKARLEPHPAVVTLLRQLHEEKVSIGIEIPDERFEHDSVARLLAGADLLALVDPKLILQSPFPVVAVEGKSVFVGRDRFLRARAGKGFTTVPDPSLVSAALRGEKLSYIRARAKQQIERDTPLRERFAWLPIVEGIELAPLRVAVEEGHPVLYAAAGERAIARLAEAGCRRAAGRAQPAGADGPGAVPDFFRWGRRQGVPETTRGPAALPGNSGRGPRRARRQPARRRLPSARRCARSHARAFGQLDRARPGRRRRGARGRRARCHGAGKARLARRLAAEEEPRPVARGRSRRSARVAARSRVGSSSTRTTRWP